MQIKLFEIRDQMTFIPAIAIALDGSEHYLLRHAGYGPHRYIYFASLNKGQITYNEFDWGDRTMHTAHKYIEDNWDTLESGAVIDVEFILGESTQGKPSQSVQVEDGGKYQL